MIIKFCSTISILNVEVITITRLHIRFENKIIPDSGCLVCPILILNILCPLGCDVINLKIHFTLLAMMPFIKLTLHILCILLLGNIRLSTPFLFITFWKHFLPVFLDNKILIFLRVSSSTALNISEENSYRRSLNTRLRQWISFQSCSFQSILNLKLLRKTHFQPNKLKLSRWVLWIH